MIPHFYENPFPANFTIDNNKIIANCNGSWMGIRSLGIEPLGK